MNQDRIDQVMQFALAVSRCVHEEDWKLRELGPIHLIKYVYLADLAYAREHGETYTGTKWIFNHFGPWAAEVHDRIEFAMANINAYSKKIDSKYGDDFTRWGIESYEEADEVYRQNREGLPMDVCFDLERVVKEFGNATSDLLHYVYLTEPMQCAAPKETLVFHVAEQKAEYVLEQQQQQQQRQQQKTQSKEQAPKKMIEERSEQKTNVKQREGLRPKAIKKRKNRLEKARARFAEKARERVRLRKERLQRQVTPRYDEVFEEGTRKLDELAGPPLEESQGTLEFSASIWKSPARKNIDDDY